MENQIFLCFDGLFRNISDIAFKTGITQFRHNDGRSSVIRNVSVGTFDTSPKQVRLFS